MTAADDLGLKEIELNVSSTILAFTEIFSIPSDILSTSHDFIFTVPAMALAGENMQVRVKVRDVRGLAGAPQT